MWKISLITKAINIIYPPICGICGRTANNGLCNKCEMMLSQKMMFGIDDYSLDCNKYFNKHIYIFSYKGIIRKLLLNYKFSEKPYLYEIFVKILKKNEKKCLFLKNYDIIIPVPISKKRKKQRGYNQSSLFARKISNFLKIEYQENYLVKIKDNKVQSLLKKEDRMNNVKNVYSICDSEKIINKKILLVDDIYTTGNTVNECSRMLIESGACEVGILTIAKD